MCAFTERWKTLTGTDQPLKKKDSMALFEEICTSPWFRYSNFILFLNKCDLFRTQIKQVPLTVRCFVFFAAPETQTG